ncbi:hypothetical protein [Myxococcus sp. CA039A]|uniref:hypothetical protein n=1 Tax=Myxococcus sp. CA039A TaxID=2741737 RepID=UPI00157B9CB9|nr:hypothetical protein [Myxococcus sp. CA039A]NTX54612.1 hypothetical protein [Myxococcus sp. CA039A]
MDTKLVESLAQRLEEAEAWYLAAVSRMDGSPEAETLLAWARESYRKAERGAVASLGARGALDLVERLHALRAGDPSAPAAAAA